MQTQRVLPRVTSVVAAAMLAFGCASTPPSEEVAEVSGRIQVGPELNPNAEGRPSPVFLRIYQLTEKTAFTSAAYDDLADRDTEVLGTSLITRDELELCPREPPEAPRSARTESRCQGEQRSLTLDIQGDARYLAVMGEFYNLHDPSGSWRDVAAIPESGMLDLFGSRSFVIELQRATVEIRFE